MFNMSQCPLYILFHYPCIIGALAIKTIAMSGGCFLSHSVSCRCPEPNNADLKGIFEKASFNIFNKPAEAKDLPMFSSFSCPALQAAPAAFHTLQPAPSNLTESYIYI